MSARWSRIGTATLGRSHTAPRWYQVGAGLLLIDGLLVVAHIGHHFDRRHDFACIWFFPLQSSAIWNGGRDGSLIELFGHLQLVTAGMLLLYVGLRVPGRQVFLAWGGVFLVMAIDDSLQIHERAGMLFDLQRVAPSLSGVESQELGGLLFWALTAVGLGAVLIVLHQRSEPMIRQESWGLLAMIGPLGCLAIGYVLMIAVRPELLDGRGSTIVVLVRVTVKLLTMTAMLVQAARLFSGPLHTPGEYDLCQKPGRPGGL